MILRHRINPRWMLIGLLLGACTRQVQVRADSTAARDSATRIPEIGQGAGSNMSLPSAPQTDWRTFHGDGFSFRYPPEASVTESSSHPSDIPGQEIRGPRIHVPVDPNRGPSDGPAYRLHVASFDNLAGLTPEAWVDSVRRSRNDHPIDADSLDYLGPPDTVTFEHVHALRLQPPCGDCSAEELFLASPQRRVLLSYIFDISIPGDRHAQQRLYSAIVSTFQWVR